MKIRWDTLLERIKGAPLDHLGGFSPKLLHTYFFGYSQALSFHGEDAISGDFGLAEFNKWFVTTAYPGPQGWASFCLLLTNTDEKALDLFYEFRAIARNSNWKDDDPFVPTPMDLKMSVLELIRSDAMRKRPAMYLANDEWLAGIWALWNGYLWAEKDIGVESSNDREVFVGFQDWLRQRYQFAQEVKFGKLFKFLALDVKEEALESFFDDLEIFLEGAAPDAHTKQFQALLDEAVASALKEQEKQRRQPPI